MVSLRLAFVIGLVCYLSSCQPAPADKEPAVPLPQSLAVIDKPGEAFLYQVWDMMQGELLPQAFVPISSADSLAVEYQFVQIDTLAPTHWRYISVYNVFEAASGAVEYAAMRFSLTPEDADTQRVAVLDARCWMNQDTAYFSDITRRELVVLEITSLTVGGQAHDIYTLAAYAHKGDVEVAHIKYWTPRYGTLCIKTVLGPALIYSDKMGLALPGKRQLAEAVYNQLTTPAF